MRNIQKVKPYFEFEYTDQSTQTSPPKMLPLRGGGSISALKPIRESEDPFAPSSALKPWGTSSSLTGPLRGTLVGRGGMSKELAIFTQGGTIRPTVEDALDRRNLPFTEYCRDVKPVTFGVIKIQNVSLLPFAELGHMISKI